MDQTNIHILNGVDLKNEGLFPVNNSDENMIYGNRITI